ncbi:G patch domain-containing protein 8 [Hypsizygus marmoreus]|uniref:G patch domain-containing protein 8 n=1 Tax=Hypsizygus marmoreus TaxID=39966 RepID=A0A369K7Z8_HYPMA|nr:G patch domain-containing protein 8 [Hypsizygus marmoreus]
MSDQSSWNYIPGLKRSRPDDEDDDDDDISIASRTPSPPPDAMDVDTDLSKYDEYVRGPAREVITVETKLKATNKGFAMLAKLGWSEGQPLGISGDGRVDPIPFQVKRDLTGLGKTNQDVRMIETTVSQRRGLDSERQQKETEEQRRVREDVVARKFALENEISTTLKAFYCTLCDKQFKNVAQYDEHTNSYAHHHKARFKDMQANVRLKPKEEIDKRKEKERKREEKELRKIAAANGIRMAKVTAVSSMGMTSVSASAISVEVDSNVAPPKRAGWATVAGTESFTPPFNVRSSGWATVGSVPAQPPTEPPASSNAIPGPSTVVEQPTHHKLPSAPAFRTAGWTSLDTGSSQAIPPGPQTPRYPIPHPAATLAPSPPVALSQPAGGWSSASPSFGRPASSGWSTVTGIPAAQPPPPSQVPPPPPNLPPAEHLAPTPPPAQPVRSGWQKFKQSGPKRR